MELCFRCSSRDAQHRPDLFVRVSLNIVENDRQTGPFGQPGDRFFEVDGRRVPVRMVSLLDGSQVVDRCHAPVTPLPRPNADKDVIDGEAMEPGRESRLAPVGGDGAPELDEDLLRQLVGPVDVSGHANAQGVDAPDVLAIQPLE